MWSVFLLSRKQTDCIVQLSRVGIHLPISKPFYLSEARDRVSVWMDSRYFTSFGPYRLYDNRPHHPLFLSLNPSTSSAVQLPFPLCSAHIENYLFLQLPFQKLQRKRSHSQFHLRTRSPFPCPHIMETASWLLRLRRMLDQKDGKKPVSETTAHPREELFLFKSQLMV